MRKKLPENYQKRIVSKFLWFPKAIGNDLRWLEMAEWEEEYFKIEDSLYGFWLATRWIS